MNRKDRGSASVEAAIVFPALIVVGLLMFAIVRTTTAQSQVSSAARAAARAAATAANETDAQARASEVALATLGDDSACAGEVGAVIEDYVPGVTVSVRVTCMSDPGFGFVVKPRTVTATAVEAISGVRGGLE